MVECHQLRFDWFWRTRNAEWIPVGSFAVVVTLWLPAEALHPGIAIVYKATATRDRIKSRQAESNLVHMLMRSCHLTQS